MTSEQSLRAELKQANALVKKAVRHAELYDLRNDAMDKLKTAQALLNEVTYHMEVGRK